MQRYRDIDGDSGVSAYETGPDSIAVQFKGGAVYLYTYESTGRTTIETMKQLAANGDGLSTYISKHVGAAYASKLK